MDWEGIRTAILDVELRKLGLPSRAEVQAARAKQAQEAAASASELETAALQRQKLQSDIESQPELTRLRSETELAQAEAAKARAGQERPDAWTITPDGKYMLNRVTGEIKPVSVPGGVGREPVDRAAWYHQYDAAGNLLGAFHAGRFYSKEEMGVPAGARRPLPSSEMEKRGNLRSILSDADELEQLARGSASQNIGTVVGRMADFQRQYMGGVDPDTADMFHISDNLADQLLRARSGAQINEQEYRRLRTLVPDPRTPKETFNANLRRFKIEVRNVLNARQGGPVTQTGPAAPAMVPGNEGPTVPVAPVEEWVEVEPGIHKLVQR